jgi:pyridoxamine 5'-phosphate oxidase
MSNPIADIRTDYKRHTLDEQVTAADPLDQFRVWFDEALAARVLEPNAMTLATADNEGRPSARIVLLKGITDEGFVFFTNYESRKGSQLRFNPYASLVFFWPELERQVRVEGRVDKVAERDSYEYFMSRPFDSRIGAWASQQSTVISGRDVLEQHFAELRERYQDGNVPLPPFWGGYALSPERVEFWQGRPGRLHDRILYTREETEGWRKERLAP